MYSCRQCTGYDECRSFLGRRGGSNICKNFNLVKENGDLVKDLVKEIRRQAIDAFIEELLKHKSKDEYPVICMDEWTLKRFAEKVNGETE